MVSAVKTEFKTSGFAELETVLVQMATDFGYKEVGAQTLRPAVNDSFREVFATARSLAPVDTGQLRSNIKQTSRRATDRDRKLRGATPTTAYISIVRARDSVGKTKAQEFGTQHVRAKHYLRNALERNAGSVITSLSGNLSERLARYQAKKIKKGK